MINRSPSNIKASRSLRHLIHYPITDEERGPLRRGSLSKATPPAAGEAKAKAWTGLQLDLVVVGGDGATVQVWRKGGTSKAVSTVIQGRKEK